MKTFLPIIENGSGSGKVSWIMCMLDNLGAHEFVKARVSDSHADRQCNRACSLFLKTDCDNMLIIDLDTTFRPQDIDRILSNPAPLLYGIYPKKQEDTPPCLDLHGIEQQPRVDGLVEARWAGRGFLRVNRGVLEAMKEGNGGPALEYHNHGETEWDFFSAGVIEGEQSCMPAGKREWVSEDIMFCLRAKKLGIPVLIDPMIALGHEGSKLYLFNTNQTTRMDSNIASWREIHGWFDYEDVYRKIVRELPIDGRFVEIGTWLGKSICAFAEFAKEAGKRIEIHTVDTFCGAPAGSDQAEILAAHGGSVEKHARENIKAIAPNVNVIAESSASASIGFSTNSLDAVYIDGDHSYSGVKRDILAWRSCVGIGGILAGHDIDQPDVLRAVKEAFGTQFEIIGRCWYHRKP